MKTKYQMLNDKEYQKLVFRATEEHKGNWEKLTENEKFELIEQTNLNLRKTSGD